MRRVVHVVRSDSFAGVERYVCDVSAELHTRGWHVDVVGGEPMTMRAHLPARVAHHPAVTVAGAARALSSIGRADIVHAHMTAAEVAAVLTKPRTRAAVVATRHFAGPRGSWPFRPLAAAMASRIDLEIAISQFVARFCRGGAVVVLNGVPDAARVADLARPAVLVMQRLEREKATGVALEAWRRSQLAEQGWRLLVVGRGVEAAMLRTLAGALGVEASVDFRGFVPDAGELRAEASVFLAPAPAEPFGLSVVEAMAAGMAVVAADGGAHPETLGETALLFPPGDVQACAAALRRLADSQELRQSLGAAARKRQRGVLTLGRHVDRLEELYRRVLETRDKARS